MSNFFTMDNQSGTPSAIGPVSGSLFYVQNNSIMCATVKPSGSSSIVFAGAPGLVQGDLPITTTMIGTIDIEALAILVSFDETVIMVLSFNTFVALACANNSSAYAVLDSSSGLIVYQDFNDKEGTVVEGVPPQSVGFLEGGKFLQVFGPGFCSMVDWLTGAIMDTFGADGKDFFMLRGGGRASMGYGSTVIKLPNDEGFITASFLDCFEIVRRHGTDVLKVFEFVSKDRVILVIVERHTFFVLKLDLHKHKKRMLTGGKGSDDAFEIVAEIEENIVSALFADGILLYTNSKNDFKMFSDANSSPTTLTTFEDTTCVSGFSSIANCVYLADEKASISAWSLPSNA